MDDLQGKVAVVTGAASGIGLALSRAFLDEGMSVVMADIEADALTAAVAALPDGAAVEAVVCDVSDGAQVDALRDTAVARFGTAHVVCNNAGVSTAAPIWTHSVSDWEWMLGVNLWGVIHGVRAFTPLLIEQGEGHIVNTASMAGLVSAPMMGIYNVTKHAVVTLTETLYADLRSTEATGVSASVLCPGWVDTQIHLAGRNRPDQGDVADGPAPEELAAMSEIVGQLLASGLDPAAVAALVVDAIRADRCHVVTHPEWLPMVSGRVDRIVAGENPIVAHLPM